MRKKRFVSCDALISVLVPMYNVEKTIARCIKSILKQTYTNLEIILLDDGSKDNTYNIAKSFADKDSRIKLLQKENEGNLSKTRNYLLDHYSGEYVVWVDSDDVIEKDYIEKLYTTLIEFDADCVACKYIVQISNMPIFKKFKVKKYIFESEDIVPQMVLNNKIYFVLWNKIYKKSILDGLRFDDSVKYGEDLIFCVAYAKRCKRIVSINENLYHYILRLESEIHQKFSDKHITFINALEKAVINEEDTKTKDVLKAWLAFSCSTLILLAKVSKYKNRQMLEKMNYYANIYKEQLLTHDKAKTFYKRIMNIGSLIWSKEKAKNIYDNKII